MACACHSASLEERATTEDLILRLADLLERDVKPALPENDVIDESLKAVAKRDEPKGPTADNDYAKEALRGHTAARQERKASNMMHLSWDQALAGR